MPDQTRNLNSVTDFAGTLDSNDRIIMTDNKASLKALTTAILGKAIIEGYTGSSLAGSSQSVKSAIDTLNSNLPYVGTGTIASAIASKVTAGVNHGFFLAKNDLADAPSGAYYKIEYIRVTGTSNVYVKAYANHAADNTYEAMFDYTNVTSLSGLWTKCPTRAEVDALNSKPTVSAIQKNGINLDTLTIPGVYACNNCTGTPNGLTGWFNVQVLPNGSGGDGNADYAIQIAIPLNSNDMYIRHCGAGTWAAWYKYTGVQVS